MNNKSGISSLKLLSVDRNKKKKKKKKKNEKQVEKELWIKWY